MFFCVTERKSRELSMLMAACVASAARTTASVSVKTPCRPWSSGFLLSTWMTPMIRPRWFFIGAARIERVR